MRAVLFPTIAFACATIGIACSTEFDTRHDDIDGGNESGTDAAPPACDPTAPFGAPVRVEGLGDGFREPTLSGDELTVYAIVGEKLAKSTRASKNAPFDGFTLVFPQPVGRFESPHITREGTELFFGFTQQASDAGLALPVDLWVGKPDDLAKAKPITNANTADRTESTPYATARGLYFVRDDPSVRRSFRILSLRRTSESFGTPDPVNGLAPPDGEEDYKPVLTPDERTIFFRRLSDTFGATGIYTATRPNLDSPFENVRRVTEIDGTYPLWVSTDACRLYFVTMPSSEVSVVMRP